MTLPIVTDAGTITGYKDRVGLLSGGSRLLAVLNRIQKKKGLVNQDVELNKSGEGFNVQYAGEALDRVTAERGGQGAHQGLRRQQEA